MTTERDDPTPDSFGAGRIEEGFTAFGLEDAPEPISLEARTPNRANTDVETENVDESAEEIGGEDESEEDADTDEDEDLDEDETEDSGLVAAHAGTLGDEDEEDEEDEDEDEDEDDDEEEEGDA